MPSATEKIALDTLRAIARGPYAPARDASCNLCLAPGHAGHKFDCPVGLAVRALDTIDTLTKIAGGR